MTSDYDLIVIGGGPGGYVAAIRASQLGKRVVCVEKEALGGICLNWGCIPTKALLRSAEVLELCRRADEFGVLLDNLRFDFQAIIQRSRKISSKINKGVAYLFKKNKIDHIAGIATLSSPSTVSVKKPDGTQQTLSAPNIILATGARARELPTLPFDDKHIIDYRRAMTMPAKPKAMIIVGAGAIGVEFASFYQALGTEVTMVEYQPSLVPSEDKEIQTELLQSFRKRGINTLLSHKVTAASSSEGALSLRCEPVAGGEAQTLQADVALVAAGVVGNVENLGLENLGIAVSRGFISVNEHLQTTVPNIYAIGDVIGPPALAHVASAEGVFAVEHLYLWELSGKKPLPVPYDSIPACTYSHPEIASVGLTEEKAKESNIPISIGKFPFRPLGKTMAAGEYPGFVKVLYHQQTGAVVGAHMIGPAVTDLIAEMTLAKTTEVNAESLVYTVHAHPTFAEAIKEATEDALGHAIHL